MSLERHLKIALDENRLVLLGTQVLFGFQFNGIFQEQFVQLQPVLRHLAGAALLLLNVTLGLLIAPSMEHRLVERGQDSPRVLALATLFAGAALLPLSVSLAIDVFIAMERITGLFWGVAAGAGFFVFAMLAWYGLEFLVRARRPAMAAKEKAAKPTPLETQVDQLLTEARLIIPGAQALLGFQLTATLMKAFQELPAEAKLVHAAALCCIGVAIILLMAPASLHRIGFRGEDDPAFIALASFFVIAAPVALAFGIALDTYIAASRALESTTSAAALAGATVLLMLVLWYGFPLWRRISGKAMRS